MTVSLPWFLLYKYSQETCVYVQRIIAAATVILLHAAFCLHLLNFSNYVAQIAQPLVPLTLLTSEHQPVQHVTTTYTVASLRNSTIAVERPPKLGLIDKSVNLPSLVNANGITVAPHVVDPVVETAMYARQAGLASGEGATVVTRVEVLSDGQIGQVQVEVSGGSAVIDAAAIAYLRSLHWISGRIGNRQETFWIRWAVRLQG